MPHIHRSALVPYSPEQMFALVNEVRAYPLFVPYCREVRVTRESEKQLRAEVHFVKGPFRQHFTTDNRLDPPGAIHLSLVDGPFSDLQGVWHFESLASGSQIGLDLQFELKKGLLTPLMTPVFAHLLEEMVGAFTQRAVQIYGDPCPR